MPFRLIVVCIVLFFSAVCYGEEVYKWIDKNGEVHFSNKPPIDGSAEKIIIKTNDKTGVNFASPEQIDALKKDIEQDKIEAEKQERRQERLGDEKRRKCTKLKDKLSEVENYLETTENSSDRKKAKNLRRLIKKDCGAGYLH